MPNRVHALVKAKQAAATQSHFDPASAQAEREQLPASHHPVLPLRELHYPPIDEV